MNKYLIGFLIFYLIITMVSPIIHTNGFSHMESWLGIVIGFFAVFFILSKVY